MEELLEMLLTDQNLSEKERRKKLKQVTEKMRILLTWGQKVNLEVFFFSPYLVSEVVPRHLQPTVSLLRASK